MLTYFRSRFFSSKKYTRNARGFSLVELIVASAIMIVVVSSVVIRFSTFDSSILLKSLGYEVALSVREAQTYSLSVVGSGTNFRTPYGMTFDRVASPQGYILFSYGGVDPRPRYDSDATVVTTFGISRSMQIVDLCQVTGGNSVVCNLDRLDIAFARPEFDALFFVNDDVMCSGDCNEVTNAAVDEAQIKVRSTEGNETWVVAVGRSGQISVCLDDGTDSPC